MTSLSLGPTSTTPTGGISHPTRRSCSASSRGGTLGPRGLHAPYCPRSRYPGALDRWIEALHALGHSINPYKLQIWLSRREATSPQARGLATRTRAWFTMACLCVDSHALLLTQKMTQETHSSHSASTTYMETHLLLVRLYALCCHRRSGPRVRCCPRSLTRGKDEPPNSPGTHLAVPPLDGPPQSRAERPHCKTPERLGSRKYSACSLSKHCASE